MKNEFTIKYQGNYCKINQYVKFKKSLFQLDGKIIKELDYAKNNCSYYSHSIINKIKYNKEWYVNYQDHKTHEELAKDFKLFRYSDARFAFKKEKVCYCCRDYITNCFETIKPLRNSEKEISFDEAYDVVCIKEDNKGNGIFKIIEFNDVIVLNLEKASLFNDNKDIYKLIMSDDYIYSQIFSKYIKDKGFEAILYKSKRVKLNDESVNSSCLVIFNESKVNLKS